ncbi:hypothetical protein Tco_0814944, partial [Tanacetum coccineum]
SRSDFAACTSVALPFPLTSTTGSFLVVYGAGSRIATLILRIHEWEANDEEMAPVRISSGPEPHMMFGQNSSSLSLHCQKTFKQISSNLVSQMSQRRLLASLQDPFLKEKKGVRFSALYLQQKRNLLVLDYSHQQDSYFFHARSVVKWINVDQLIGKGNLLLDLQKLQKNPIFRISVDIRQNTNYVRAFTTSANVPSIYIQLFWNTLTHDAKTGVYSFQVNEHWLNLSADLLRKALNRWIIASQDETTGPSVHPEDATSTKMVRETLSHADAESGGNSEKINSETDTEILNVGSNSKQSHVALAGPNPEHMQDVFLATNYPKGGASSGPEPFMMTPGQLNSGLAPSHVPATTNIPPTDKDLEILFQPMFDEYFEQSTDSEPVPTATVVNAPIVSTNTSASTMIAQDAPSTSHSLSSSQVHPPVFPQGEPSSAQSTSGDVSLAEPNQVNQPPDHLRKWTKDHPLDNIVGNPSRPVSTRKQLASDALWCCYHTVLSKVEPKNFKMAVNEDSWFEAM